MANRKTSGARRKPQPRKGSSPGAPPWVWVLLGLLPGLVIAYLVHDHHQTDSALTTGGGPSGGSPATGTNTEGERPRFEFYELLSEMEVVVPDEADRDTDAPEQAPSAPQRADAGSDAGEDAPAPQPSAADNDAGQYMVQAGSFRSHEDADRLKARLALMGVQATIQSVEVEGGETWHRVRIGPFADRGRVETLRGRLRDEEVDSILLRLRG